MKFCILHGRYESALSMPYGLDDKCLQCYLKLFAQQMSQPHNLIHLYVLMKIKRLPRGSLENNKSLRF